MGSTTESETLDLSSSPHAQSPYYYRAGDVRHMTATPKTRREDMPPPPRPRPPPLPNLKSFSTDSHDYESLRFGSDSTDEEMAHGRKRKYTKINIGSAPDPDVTSLSPPFVPEGGTYLPQPFIYLFCLHYLKQ